MGPRLRAAVLAFVSLAFVAVAYGPLERADFTGADLERLARAGGWHLPSLPSEPARRTQTGDLDVPARSPLQLDGRELLRVAGPEGSFLSGFSLSTSYWLYGSAPKSATGRVPALPYRLEHLALLLVAAVGLWRSVRRLLLPWTGSEQAHLAGWAAGLLFAVHPACVASVASLEGRADLMALAFSSFSAALFLRARQERAFAPMVGSVVLAFLAAFSGELAFGLPFALALAEGLSAHRYRPKHRRLRTALNTFFVFFGITALHGVAVASVSGHSYLPEVALGVMRLGEPGALAPALFALAEKIGLALLPANGSMLGASGFVLAGVLLLAALQPALFAARSAPRLWGGVLLWWVGAFAFALLFGVDRAVEAERLAGARELLPAAFVVAGALGTASTAMGGVRRRLLPIALAFGLAVLSHANAQPWREASRALNQLRRDVIAAREQYGREASLCILDAPRNVGGLDALGPGLPWLLHPVFTGLSGESEPLRVRDLDSAAFLMALRAEDSEFRARGPWLVLYPRAALGRGGPEGPARGREARLLPARGSPGGPLGWVEGASSPPLDVDPRAMGALRVAMPPGVGGYEPGLVRWQGSLDGEGAAVRGVWVSSKGRRIGWFDLSQELSWVLATRVRRLWFEEPGPVVERADLLPFLAAGTASLEPRVDGDDWIFPAPDAQSRLLADGGAWRLSLLDLSGFGLQVFWPVEEGGGELRARGAERWCRERQGAPVALELDLLVDGAAVLRSAGRR